MRGTWIVAGIVSLLSFVSADADCVQRARVVYNRAAAVNHAAVVHDAYPVAVKAFVSPDYYASTSDYYRDKLLVDAVAGKATELANLQLQIQQLQFMIQQQSGGVVRPLSPPSANPAGAAPPPPAAPPEANASFDPKVMAIIQGTCLRCHGAEVHATKGGGFPLHDLSKLSLDDWRIVHSELCSGHMPKGGTKLAQAEIELFTAQVEKIRSIKSARK